MLLSLKMKWNYNTEGRLHSSKAEKNRDRRSSVKRKRVTTKHLTLDWTIQQSMAHRSLTFMTVDQRQASVDRWKTAHGYKSHFPVTISNVLFSYVTQQFPLRDQVHHCIR